MSDRQLVFVGTYSEPILFGTGQVLQGKGQGIHAFWLDRTTGQLTPGPVTKTRNPSYLAFDPSRRFLYAVNEFKEYEGMASGAVSAFRIDAKTGELAFLNQRASQGTDPCHLMADRTGKCVLVANFASGSVAVLPIMPDGSLAEASCVIQHEGSSLNPTRQKGPHAHAVELDAANRYAFVPELGVDRVMIYRLDPAAGKLTPNPDQKWISMRPGAGPRQIVFHPGGKLAFLINELDCTMTSYRYDSARGGLEEIQTLPTLPAGFTGNSSCAEVQIAPSGKFLYGSNRGHNTLATYRIDAASGKMQIVGFQPTGGAIPRNFEVDSVGSYLAAANQESNNVVIFRLDNETGKMTPTGSEVDVGTPVCVRFL